MYTLSNTHSFTATPIRIIIVVILLIISFSAGYTTGFHTAAQQGTTQQLQIAAPSAQEAINKTFQFPINDSTGKEITKLAYTIQSVQLQNEIIIRGQAATAVKGKTFLIFNLKITNTSDQSVQINTRDYLRVSVGNGTDLLAPDIHNDPLQVQPISTAYTRVGLTVSDTDEQFLLHVGAVTGDKTLAHINFLKK